MFVRATSEEREWLVTNFPQCDYIRRGLFTIIVPDSEVVADLLWNCARDEDAAGCQTFYRGLWAKIVMAKSIESTHEPLELWEFQATAEVARFAPVFEADDYAFHDEEEFE